MEINFNFFKELSKMIPDVDLYVTRFCSVSYLRVVFVEKFVKVLLSSQFDGDFKHKILDSLFYLLESFYLDESTVKLILTTIYRKNRKMIPSSHNEKTICFNFEKKNLEEDNNQFVIRSIINRFSKFVLERISSFQTGSKYWQGLFLNIIIEMLCESSEINILILNEYFEKNNLVEIVSDNSFIAKEILLQIYTKFDGFIEKNIMKVKTHYRVLDSILNVNIISTRNICNILLNSPEKLPFIINFDIKNLCWIMSYQIKLKRVSYVFLIESYYVVCNKTKNSKSKYQRISELFKFFLKQILQFASDETALNFLKGISYGSTNMITINKDCLHHPLFILELFLASFGISTESIQNIFDDYNILEFFLKILKLAAESCSFNLFTQNYEKKLKRLICNLKNFENSLKIKVAPVIKRLEDIINNNKNV